jgi:3',5'-cyclic AMP phosphodiesterase CpdA
MTTFLLAHLSDPHLAPLPQPRLPDLLGKRAIGFINWQRKRRRVHRMDVLARITDHLKAHAADHIAVTGDLVNLSLADEFAPARAFLESLGPAHDVTLVPGNHDAYVRGAVSYAGAHWGDFMRGDVLPGDVLREDVLPGDVLRGDDGTAEAAFPFVRRRGPLALIGLSSAVPTAPFMATGRLGSAQLRRLAATLDRHTDAFRVVLVHHPPKGPRSRYFKRLIDAPQLRDVLARHGAELLIHGHDHVHSLTWLAGPRRRIAAVGVPSASQALPAAHEPAGYNLYAIEGQPGAWRCEVISHALSHALSRGLPHAAARDGQAVVEIRRKQLIAA